MANSHDSGTKKRTAVIIRLSILLMLMALSSSSVYLVQGYKSFAAPKKCQKIAKVAVNPESISVLENSDGIGLSAIAYDESGQPVFKGVNYDWGISSDNTVGDLKQKNDLATFIPMNPGRGDLFVEAKNACTKEKVLGSVPVTIRPAISDASPE